MKEIQKKYKQAVQEIQTRNFTNAITKLSQIIPLVVNSDTVDNNFEFLSQCFTNRSYCYEEIGNYDAALADAEECIKYNPNNPEAYRMKSTVLGKLYQTGKALEQIEKALDLAPNNKAYLHEKAIFLSIDKEYPKAIEILNQLIEEEPNNFDYLLTRSSCFIGISNFKAGFDDINKVIEIAPENPKGYYHRILHLFQNKQIHDAFEECRILVNRFKDFQAESLPLLHSIGTALEKERELSKVKDSFEYFADQFVQEHIEGYSNAQKDRDRANIQYFWLSVILIVASTLFLIFFLIVSIKGFVEGWGLLPMLSCFTLVSFPFYFFLSKLKNDYHLAISVMHDHKSKKDIYSLVYANSNNSKASNNLKDLISYYQNNSITKILLLKSDQGVPPASKVVKNITNIFDKNHRNEKNS